MKYLMILALVVLTVECSSLRKRLAEKLDVEDVEIAAEKRGEETLDEVDSPVKRNEDVDEVALESRRPYHHHRPPPHHRRRG